MEREDRYRRRSLQRQGFVEVRVRLADVRLRVSGPEDVVDGLLDELEGLTDASLPAAELQAPKQLAGQTNIYDVEGV